MGVINMADFISRDIKNSWGIRCTEDVNGRLWIGKSGSVPFEVVFKGLQDIIKAKLRDVRNNRGGAFWINPQSKNLTIVTEATVESQDYPQVSYD